MEGSIEPPNAGVNFRTFDLHGVRVIEWTPEEFRLRNERDAVDLIATASGQNAGMVLIPADHLGEDFFDLKTRVAGEIIQKFVTYRMRVAIAGDITKYLRASSALRDFVHECNQGSNVWFVEDLRELGQRLKSQDVES